MLDLVKRSSCCIFSRKQWHPHDRPVNSQIGVVPEDHALKLRGVVIGGLVEEFGRVAEYDEAVREARRNPQLAFVVGREDLADPSAKGRRILADIYRHIEDLAGNGTH